MIGLAGAVLAEVQKCFVCDQVLAGKYYRAEDNVRGGMVDICTNCAATESRCFACGLPVKSEATKLEDGRWLCGRDARDAIRDDDEAKRICCETRADINRLFWDQLKFPSTNVVLNIVDQFTLESLFKSPGHGQRCTSVFGATRSSDLGDGRLVHSINILSSLNKTKLGAVAAHEFGHVWLNENLSQERKATLSPDAVEAFCELVAYELMDRAQEKMEKKFIKENPYTRGQLDAFLTARDLYGFASLVTWMKSGRTGKLDAADPDGVNALHAAKSPTAFGLLNPVPPPPAPLPDKLILQAITGTTGRRFAIINDRTFGVKDLARMRLAQTNFSIRCLEIRADSVLIQIAETGEKQKLSLLAAQPPPGAVVR